jgi:hypothetical protein
VEDLEVTRGSWITRMAVVGRRARMMSRKALLRLPSIAIEFRDVNNCTSSDVDECRIEFGA